MRASRSSTLGTGGTRMRRRHHHRGRGYRLRRRNSRLARRRRSWRRGRASHHPRNRLSHVRRASRRRLLTSGRRCYAGGDVHVHARLDRRYQGRSRRGNSINRRTGAKRRRFSRCRKQVRRSAGPPSCRPEPTRTCCGSPATARRRWPGKARIRTMHSIPARPALPRARCNRPRTMATPMRRRLVRSSSSEARAARPCPSRAAWLPGGVPPLGGSSFSNATRPASITSSSTAPRWPQGARSQCRRWPGATTSSSCSLRRIARQTSSVTLSKRARPRRTGAWCLRSSRCSRRP